jgi:hypothetical protein
MKRIGYKARSIQIPEWVENATRELAAKNGRSVSSEIRLLVESAIRRQYGLSPDGYEGNRQDSAAQANGGCV